MTFSATELSRIRATVEAFLPDTCTIQTVSQVSDGMGGWTDTWANTYTSVPCHVWMKTGREAVDGNRVVEVTRWVINVAHDQTLTAKMRVVHGGNTYQVNDSNDDGTDKAQVRAWLTRIN